MPKADATGLAPKKSADTNPPAQDPSVREGFGFHSCPAGISLLLLRCTQSSPQPENQTHFFGEVF
jgi:hypothetical protein